MPLPVAYLSKCVRIVRPGEWPKVAGVWEMWMKIELAG